MQSGILFKCSMFVSVSVLSACVTTSHSSNPLKMGIPSNQETMEKIMYESFPMKLERFTMASNRESRAGLVDLENNLIEKLKYKDGLEPTFVFMYRFRHRDQGTWFVNSGVARQFKKGADHSDLGYFMKSSFENLRFKLDTKTVVDKSTDFRGVLFTNLRLHHLLGVPDLPHLSKLISGPSEASDRDFDRFWSQSSANNMLHNKRAIRELQFGPKKQGRVSILDLFGDQSVFAIHLPGYSSGSIAYLIRTVDGPHLIASDVSPTVFGMVHGIAPGEEAMEQKRAYSSLQWLRFFVNKHPKLQLHIGRQVFAKGTKLKSYKKKPEKKKVKPAIQKPSKAQPKPKPTTAKPAPKNQVPPK